VFCLDRAGITGDDGPSHHGVLDLMLLSKVPGMTVFVPSSYEEVGNMLHEALENCSGPVAIRWPKTQARSGSGVGSGLRGRRLRAGTRVCILGVGKLVEACEEAARLLEREGIDATVWDVRVASPLDPAMIDDALTHELVVTAEDGIVAGGIGQLIEAAVRRAAPAGTVPTVRNLGVPLSFLPQGRAADLLTSLGLDGAGITAAALEAL
jgi:1-deoxy-D-xylulose-5-phosphate synthase